MEEAICDSYSMRSFLGVNVIDEQVSDATAMLKFRHLIEKTSHRRKNLSGCDRPSEI